jgi:hypothetical protein
MFDSSQEADVAAELARELRLNPAPDTPVDEPLLEELQRIDDEVFDREFLHPERYTADLESAIRERAYCNWELDGRPEGRDVDHWLAAEQQIREEIRTPSPGNRRGPA